MLSVDEAITKVIKNIKTLAAETRPVLESRGQVLAENIVAKISIPPMDNSAMDGYAVLAADTAGASEKRPCVFKVIDTVIAGAISKKRVTAGTAVRIMTGAPIPPGADAVVRFEDTDNGKPVKTGEVRVFREVTPGSHIRRAGDDIKKGSVVITKGTVLNPAHLGMIASLGISRIKVIRRPRVAVLVTGNELVEIGRRLPAGKIYNSNSYTISSLVSQYGGIPELLGIAGDDKETLVSLIRRGLKADMLVTTGGVSEGDLDLVKDIIEKEGRTIFRQVRLKPGKPVVFGLLPSGKRKVPHFGLPGNTVSSMVAFELFTRPAILKMSGKTNLGKRFIKATVEDTIKNDDGRRVFARAFVECRDNQYYARTYGHQGSHVLTSMGQANGLIVVPEDKALVKPGETVDVMMLDWGGEGF